MFAQMKNAGKKIYAALTSTYSHSRVGRHVSEDTVVKCSNMMVLADATLSKPMLTWLNHASLDKELILQRARS